ncbi:MAG: hypothetical protein IT425_00485, partial [Pirellulales bacterium]|nr:hypothetical protein [Pirellulales bacterium]
MRLLILSFLLIACSFAAAAKADVAFQTVREGSDEIQIVRMTVTPAAEPVPAFKHRLLARGIDLKPGNAAPYYYRAHGELRSTLKHIRDKFDEDTELSNWYGLEDSTPIAKLPLERVREACAMFDGIYQNDLRQAFARRDCDWELGVEELRGVDAISVLLDEFQNSRGFARMMAMRTRLAIAEHRYDDAIETMRHQYRLGSDVAKEPFLVCGLFGMAMDFFANGTMIELIANPDSPNMYWALTQLPQPAIDMRPAVRFEADSGLRMCPFINHAETTELAPQEWNRLYTQALHDLGNLTWQMINTQGSGKLPKPLQKARAGMVATALALHGYPHAKQWLIAHGMERDRVEQMAVGQVLAIYSDRIYRQYADDFEKCWYVPFAEMNKYGGAADQRLASAGPLGTSDDREIVPIASMLLPGLRSARTAQGRLEREIASLRVIEALRMHAANHNRQLPKSLDEITAVPVPLNPATGK